jgi:hypothetical protein
MKLTQALKTKTRLAGELVRLQQIFNRENSRRNDNPSTVNPAEIFKKIEETSDTLGAIKAKIAAANVPIYSKIERMAEAKSKIALLQHLPVREGKEKVSQYNSSEPLTYTWTTFINQKNVDEMVFSLQNQINSLQDEIDNFNATTEITK